MPDATPVDPLKPAAGGWSPTPAQQGLGVAACAFLMGMAPVCLEIPGITGKVSAGVCGALAAGLGVLLGLRSAGPRVGV